MARRIILNKEDGSKEVIDPNCQNCGNWDEYELGREGDSMNYFLLVTLGNGFVASATINLNMKIKLSD